VHKILILKVHKHVYKVTTHIVSIQRKVEQLNFNRLLNCECQMLVVVRSSLCCKKSICHHCLWSKLNELDVVCLFTIEAHTSGLIILNQGALKHIRYRFICHVRTAFGNRVWTKQRMTFRFCLYIGYKVRHIPTDPHFYHNILICCTKYKNIYIVQNQTLICKYVLPREYLKLQFFLNKDLVKSSRH
jgi:hypothetical protein